MTFLIQHKDTGFTFPLLMKYKKQIALNMVINFKLIL